MLDDIVQPFLNDQGQMVRRLRSEVRLIGETTGENQALGYCAAVHRQVSRGFGFELGARLGYD